MFGFSKPPKCPKCGGILRVTKGALADNIWRCDNCVRMSNQQDEIDDLKRELEELKIKLKS